MDISEKILEDLFSGMNKEPIMISEWGINREPDFLEKSISILGSTVRVITDNNEKRKLLLNNPKFLQNNIIQPIIKNWPKILKLASTFYDKMKQQKDEYPEDLGDYGFKDKSDFIGEIKPTVAIITIYKKRINIDLQISTEKFNDVMGGHDLFVYITDGAIDRDGIRMEG